MKCSKCLKDFPENQIDESHDVPCYLFEGIKRNIRKNQADKFGRRWLCHNCHVTYENKLRNILQQNAEIYSKIYFMEDKK